MPLLAAPAPDLNWGLERRDGHAERGGQRGVLISFPRLQPLRDLMMIHQIASRQPVWFY